MTLKGMSILSNPHPRGHIVYPYTGDSLVCETVAFYTSAGLRNGEAVLLVITQDHVGPVDRLLVAEGLNTEELQRNGYLTYAIAEKLMPAFMVDGLPDEELFKAVFGQMIERAQAVSSENHRPGLVRAFGEMVDLLWSDSVTAAEQVEAYWDDLIERYSISLLCTYALSGARPKLAPSLLNCHSHALQAHV